MKIIYNSLIPFKGFSAMNFFTLLFVRNDLQKPLSQITLNHEAIHSEQYKDLLYILYLPLYVLEWFIKLFVYWSFKKAYYNISFEREAYSNQDNFDYIKTRKRFAWFKRIIK